MVKESLNRLIKNRIFLCRDKNLNLTKISGFLLILTTILFFITQLAVNADLNPKGERLEILNTEKNLLIEENRRIEEEIARSGSLKVINQIASQKLNLKDNTINSTKYISDSKVLAENK